MNSEQVKLSELPIENLLGVFIGILSNKAVEHMGLLQEGQKDLKLAAITIDCVDSLTKQLEKLAPESAKTSRGLVSELQMAYVKASHE